MMERLRPRLVNGPAKSWRGKGLPMCLCAGWCSLPWRRRSIITALHIVENRGESDPCGLVCTFKEQGCGRGGRECRELPHSGSCSSEDHWLPAEASHTCKVNRPFRGHLVWLLHYLEKKPESREGVWSPWVLTAPVRQHPAPWPQSWALPMMPLPGWWTEPGTCWRREPGSSCKLPRGCGIRLGALRTQQGLLTSQTTSLVTYLLVHRYYRVLLPFLTTTHCPLPTPGPVCQNDTDRTHFYCFIL